MIKLVVTNIMKYTMKVISAFDNGNDSDIVGILTIIIIITAIRVMK